MKLTFPFRNMAINDLLRFIDAYKFLEFIDVQKNNDPNVASYFNPYLEMYDSGLANFENELIQVINTTDQATIDSYFSSLAQDIQYLKQRISVENITEIVNRFNAESLARLEKEINDKTEEYFKSDHRKLKHLEEYESTNYLLFDFNKSYQSKHINYNFYCAEQFLKYIEPAYIPKICEFIKSLADKFFAITSKFGTQWAAGKILTKHVQFIKPILFVEGNLDICYISRAATLLDRPDFLDRIDLRQRGSCHKLDALWDIYKNDNFETVPQKKIFLYDCDTGRTDEDNGWNYRRIIPQSPTGPVKRGIENLFNEEILQKAFAYKSALDDIITFEGTKRGEKINNTEFTIDKQEKKNLCDWICENGDADTFKNFEILFSIVYTIIG